MLYSILMLAQETIAYHHHRAHQLHEINASYCEDS